MRRLDKVKALEARALMHIETGASRHERVRSAAAAPARRRRELPPRPGPPADSTRACGPRDASLWTGADESRWLGWLSAPADAAAARPRARGVCSTRSAPTASPMSCCWAWAGRACARKCWPSRSASSRLAEAARARLDGSRTGRRRRASRPARHDAGDRREQVGLDARAQHLQRVLLRSHGRHGRRGARRRVTSSPSPIRDRSSRPPPGATASGASSRAVPSIGGRYSALSPFGLVPAAAMGLDLARWVGERGAMAEQCASRPSSSNPGVALGLVLGTCARLGIDKLTLIVSPRIYDLGAWLEQLVAESTGKNGHADHPRRPRAARPADGLRRRSPLRLRPAVDRARRCAGCRRRGARRRRAGPWCASTCRTSTRWQASSSGGRSPRPWPAP